MRFFEFSEKNGAPYYALIGADTPEEATGFYKKEVCKLDDDFKGPLEVSNEFAAEKYTKAGAHEAENDFKYYVHRNDKGTFLIDGCLD